MKTSRQTSFGPAGFTLTEVMITMSIALIVTAGASGILLMGLRTMYKDTQRLVTDATLRQLTLHVAKQTIDASGFYLFPTYEKLDGSVNLDTDVAQLDPAEPEEGEIQLASGDCLVLVTRVRVEATSNVRQFRIYYRAVTSADAQGSLRYYESPPYGTAETGTATPLATLLNGVNLKVTPAYPGSRVLAATTRGKRREDGSGYYPVFSTQGTVTTAANESISLNIEVINGTSANNLLSSSSFNYTISPRK